MGTATLMWEVLFSSIGKGFFFIYGKRQGAPVPSPARSALMLFPYFISNAWSTGVVSALLLAIPYFVPL